jgi:hypothetical protein
LNDWHHVDEETFTLDACRTDLERELTLALNAHAKPWIDAGACLIGPVVQQYDERKLVFFLDPPDAQLIRVEFHNGKAVIGFDLTGQGGADLDSRAPGVSVVSTDRNDPERLASVISEHLDALFAQQADAQHQRAQGTLKLW